MTEQELRRTAVIIPPSGRAVLCVWAAVPGLFAAPFVFWQSLAAGTGFYLLWAALLTSVRLLRTPLMRLGGVSLLIVAAPGAKLILPAIPAQQAGLLAHILAEEVP